MYCTCALVNLLVLVLAHALGVFSSVALRSQARHSNAGYPERVQGAASRSRTVVCTHIGMRYAYSIISRRTRAQDSEAAQKKMRFRVDALDRSYTFAVDKEKAEAAGEAPLSALARPLGHLL